MEGGAPSDDFCCKTENFRWLGGLDRGRGEEKLKTDRRKESKKAERQRGGSIGRAKLIRGNEGGFSLLQQGTLRSSRCCELKVRFRPTAAQNRVKIGSQTHKHLHTQLYCRDDLH